MKHTIADRREWQGFQPTAYTLSGRVLSLPLARLEEGAEGKATSAPTTVGEVLSSLSGQRIEDLDSLLPTLRIVTDQGKIAVEGPPFHLSLLERLLLLQKDGVNGLGATWFWYDRYSSYDDPSDYYSFFVVFDGKIVSEHLAFSDWRGSSFDPTVFEEDKPLANTSNAGAWKEAANMYWYRRFYTETGTGKLMVLRPDEPILHHFPEGRLDAPVLTQSILVWLAQIRRLLSWLVFLATALLLLLLVRWYL